MEVYKNTWMGVAVGQTTNANMEIVYIVILLFYQCFFTGTGASAEDVGESDTNIVLQDVGESDTNIVLQDQGCRLYTVVKVTIWYYHHILQT